MTTTEREARERNHAQGEYDLDDPTSMLAELVETVNSTSAYGIRGDNRADRIRCLARVSFIASRMAWLEAGAQANEEMFAQAAANTAAATA